MYQNHWCSSLDLTFIFLIWFQHTFYLKWNALGFFNSGWLSLANTFMSAVALLILCHIMLTGLYGNLWLYYKTTIDRFPSLLLWRKTFPFLDSFNYLNFRIRNPKPAIPFLPSFSAHLRVFSQCLL
jgi:hypothetical protein